MNDGAQNTTAATSQAGTVTAAEPSTLEGLLEQFNKGTASPEVTSAVTQVLKGIQPLVEDAADRKNQQAIERQTKDMAEAVAEVKKAIGDDSLDDDVVEGYIRQFGFKNPDVEKAWQTRLQTPDAWKTSVTKVAESAKAKIRPGSTLRADTEAARAAVQNSSRNAPPPMAFDAVKASQMSDRGWSDYKKELAQAARSK